MSAETMSSFRRACRRASTRWSRSTRSSARRSSPCCSTRRTRSAISPTRSSPKSPAHRHHRARSAQRRHLLLHAALQARGQIQRSGLHQHQLHVARRLRPLRALPGRAGHRPQRRHRRRRLLARRGRVHRRLLLGAGHSGQLRLPRRADARPRRRHSRRLSRPSQQPIQARGVQNNA